jgi:hypothetical protein
MKKILLTLVACAAITLSANAQGGPRKWVGGPTKSYVDRSTLDKRAQQYHFIINDKSSDVYLSEKNGKKCWFGGAIGKDFMGWYDECITRSEKKILDKNKKSKVSNKVTLQNNSGNPFAD